jgi:hypothetical protein
VSRLCPRIALIQGPIDPAIKKHRRSPRTNHANKHQNQNSRRWHPTGGNNKRAQRKGQRENGVRESDQSQEAFDRVSRSDLVAEALIVSCHD